MLLLAAWLAVTPPEVAPHQAEPPRTGRPSEYICFLPLEDEEGLDLLAGCRACKPARPGQLVRLRTHFMKELIRLAADVTHRQPRG